MVARLFWGFYDWDSVPVDGTHISCSVVDIIIEFPFTVDLSPSISKEFTSEV